MDESATWEMESIWSNLPGDILKRVFMFLPIASVCRFMTLSKSWNKLITSLPFRHAQASNVSPEEYLLSVAPRSRFRSHWRVLDVARKRFLTFSNEFLTNQVKRQGLAPLINCGSPYLAVAAGGLFCVEYLCYKTNDVIGHVVCNPVLKTFKQLPHLAVWSGKRQVTVMSIDRVSMEYEIFVVNFTYHDYIYKLSKPLSILVYESKTSNWRQAPYKPLNPPVNYPNYQVRWGTLTIFRDQLYCIANKGSCGGIVSYNKETGEVSDLAGVDMPLAYPSHLVVGKDKLLCVIPVQDNTNDFPYGVKFFEINSAKKESILLTEMPQDLLLWVLGHDHERRVSWKILLRKIKVVVESADSILIYTVVGRCTAYSLSKDSWYQYPDDLNLLKAFCLGLGDSWTYEKLCGSSYCLSLVPP